ncbi:MFS transporter, AAHS family, 4-hydroxybenzoate transporter [Bradyrhizobium erythrophlei]|jgi:MFS transporter, AAHS family, 4-hydroxybenzoate transporter|uniref:MFS transporter, AAHS family, 4-hydroxybenzoate transporter n=1 Tax=Bradyrhizobium erythrophlei TaxID=1437360 RepID=A0A1M5L9S7_9BRAD|nr:MFS transporter, AAHS family, 4-hydroxybenzoate transporter [Bradyrhizobium erythrophlei]
MGGAVTDHTKVDVAAVINDSEISRFQYIIFTLCILIMMCDGFDTQALAYVAPSIASEWKLSPGIFGPVFAAVLLGSMVGAFGFGYLADRFGRKRTLVLCMILFGALNIGSAYATSIESFTLLRFLCGIGLGGVIPNVMALVSEYAPARRRATLVAITWCGFSLGAVLGGLISVPLISHFGWKSVFVFGGILPLCLVAIVVFALPESIKFLILARGKGVELVAVLRKLNPGRHFDDSSAFVLDEPRLGRGSISALFRDGLAIGSVFLCLAFFMSLMLVYLFINWIPLLLRQAGLPLQDAMMGTIIFNLSGIFGSVFCTQFIDRKILPPMFILIFAYFVGAAAVFAIGFAGTSFWPIMGTIFLGGFFIIGAQLSLNALITNYYPTAIRGTGVGWSQVVGRTGSLLGPLMGGALVSQGMSPSQLFQVSSIAPLLACACLLVFMKFSSSAMMTRSVTVDVTP